MPSPALLVTPGDPDGIGPEILAKTIRLQGSRRRGRALVAVGARAPFDALPRRLRVPVREISEGELAAAARLARAEPGTLLLLPAPTRAPEKGKLLPGYQCGWAIEKATRLIQAGSAAAIVTGPISKERLQAGGFRYAGHTDFLADLCGGGAVTMMLANDQLRISLVTTHLALADVPRAITRERLRTAIRHTARHLREWWGIAKPRIAVAALNPHAGEAGLFGREEIEVISPALAELRREARGAYQLEGPAPADTLFAMNHLAPRSRRFDAVVCMYHDQGLIPVKLLDFPNTVNVTLGLPIVRTSVDHGTAFDIAGRGIADPSSLQAAIELAARVVTCRN